MVTKYCPRCGQEKDVSCFYKNRRRGDGLQSWCKPCLDEKSSQYDKSKANKIYQQLHRKEANEAVKKYRSTKQGAEKVRQYHLSDAYKAIKKRWEQSPQGKESRQVRHERRRAAERNCESTLTLSEWRDIISNYGGRCAYCGKKSDKLTQEHVVPLSRGGDNSEDNVVPACGQCNESKNNKPLLVWMWKRLSY